MAINLLTNVTTVTTGTGSLLVASPSESFILSIAATGNFTAVVVVEQSVDNSVWTLVKSWSVGRVSAYTDSYSVDVPTGYYVRASLQAVSGTGTSVSVVCSQQALATSVALLSTDINGNVIGLVKSTSGLIAANGALDIRGFGAKSDGAQVLDATVTASATTTVISATASFTASDVGKPCVVINSSNTPSSSRYGTIASYQSTTQVTVSLNGAPNAGTNQEFIWGTDDTTAINAALSYASSLSVRRSIYIPNGITVFTSRLTVPVGVNVLGSGNTPSAGVPYAMKWTGSTLVYVGNDGGAVPVVTVGDGVNTTVGVMIFGINIDFTNCAQYGLKSTSWQMNLTSCTIARAWYRTVTLAGSSTATNCSIYNQGFGIPLDIEPSDVRVINCYIFGGQVGNPIINVNGSADVLISGNHMYRSPDATNITGDMILVSDAYGTGIGLNRGAINIVGNVFDSCNGYPVHISVTASSTLQSINISGNSAFQNSLCTSSTWSFVRLDIAAGSVLRAITISGNTGQGDFNNIANAWWKSVVDGTGIVGSIYGSTVVANAFDNCGSLYTSFTPNYTAGNITIAGQGTTVVVG